MERSLTWRHPSVIGIIVRELIPMAGIFLVGWKVLEAAQVIPFFNPLIMMGRSPEVIPEYYIGPAIVHWW